MGAQAMNLLQEDTMINDTNTSRTDPVLIFRPFLFGGAIVAAVLRKQRWKSKIHIRIA